MPTYSFINNDTQEEFDIVMTISERDEYVKNNPNHTQILKSAPMMIQGHRSSSTSLGKNKGFKEVLNNIHKRTPGSVLNKTTDL